MSIIVTDDNAPAGQRPNGKSAEYVRWVVTLALAALVAYYSAQGAIQAEIASIRATQNSQFGEVLRRLEILQEDIREIRSRP